MSDFPSQNKPLQGRAPALTVSELNRQVKHMLEISYAQVWVTGELSGLARPSSGHWYFSLKDDRAQIRCAMFRGANQRLRFQPKDGDKLVVRGKLSLYEGRGEYQLIVESMEPHGVGQLQAAFEALKLKLSQEGLFEQRAKKALPNLAKRVCVITSRSGAVIHDIIHVAHRRFPALEILLIPVAVQGDNAASEIASAIELANVKDLADALIVGRGGGSLEDLWAFNEEIVARAIFNSRLPVISAVGHEVDLSIADMVADVRAPTPSAAAEYLTPDQYELTQKLDDQLRRLSYLVNSRLSADKRVLDSGKKRLQSPIQALAAKAERAASLEKSLLQLTQINMQRTTSLLRNSEHRLQRFEPRKQISDAKNSCQQTFALASELLRTKLTNNAHRLALASNKLNLVSPLATLERGYSVLLDENGKAVSSHEQVNVGDTLNAKLVDGLIEIEVKGTHR